MIQHYRTLKEGGWKYAESVANQLKKQGMEILSIKEGRVPFCEGPGREDIMVKGFLIEVDDGFPPLYKEGSDSTDIDPHYLWG